MITPIFKLAQDAEHLYITIVAPNMRLAEAELYHEGNEFIFHAKPYYLRLNLPAQVQTSERTEPQDGTLAAEQSDANSNKVKFNFDTKELVVSVPKMNKDEHFPDLDMVGKFLTGPKSNASRRLVEVLDSTEDTPLIDDLRAEEEEDFDWNIEQKLSLEGESASSLLGNEPYGFANSQSGVLERMGQELTHDLVDIEQPGTKTRSERRQLRLRQEEEQFSEDHYIADLYDTERIDQLMATSAPWDKWDAAQPNSILTNEDRQGMIDHLPKREFLKFDSSTKKALMLGVVDILYAYAYDLRTNDFEHSSESSWTIRKLSPTLSWLEYWVPIDLQHQNDMASYVLLSCIRRSLIYPLYRNWSLAMKVARDVVTILGKGRSAILKCFLDVHRLMNETGDNHYLLNDLYITDYCCWLQQLARPNQFDSLAAHLNLVISTSNRISKNDLCLDIVLTEKAAELAWNESKQAEEEISRGLKDTLQIKHSGKDELDSDDDEES